MVEDKSDVALQYDYPWLQTKPYNSLLNTDMKNARDKILDDIIFAGNMITVLHTTQAQWI
jgi:hypothetical protein